MKLTDYDIIIRPIITEKSMSIMVDRKYTFIVKKSANKIQVRNGIIVEKRKGYDLIWVKDLIIKRL